MLFRDISSEARNCVKISLPAILFFFFLLDVSGQKYLTLDSGVSFSDVIGVRSETFQFRNGYFFGVRYNTLFSDPLSFGTGLSFQTNGISNSYQVTKAMSEFIYYNNVDQVSLYAPFLLTYHSRRFSFELGPHIRNMIRVRQIETEITESRIPGRERIEETFINRQEFNKMLIGMTFGLNLKLIRNIDLSLKYLQTFTSPGKEYSWQRQRVFQAGISLNPGRNFTPGRLSSGRPSQGADDEYRTLSSSNIIRLQYRYLGEGNNVFLRFRTADKAHYRLVEMVVGNSSGELQSADFQNTIWNADFPFIANIRFTCHDPGSSLSIHYALVFEITRKGSWEVIIHY
jgi:hypothetical protein